MITANFATHRARRHTIDKAVNSIKDQVDVVRVYYNDYEPQERLWNQYTGEDLTDKGKFYGIEKGEIAFTCDDDILYPPDYVDKTLERLKEYPIVTYHGRKLSGKGKHYYRAHTSFHFLQTVIGDHTIDVAGTGVTAFDTSVFMPDILQYSDDKMVDLLFSLEAKKKGVDITCCQHKTKWFTILTSKESIYAEMVNSCDRQSELADSILSIK